VFDLAAHEPVPVWVVDRDGLLGPYPALAVVYNALNGSACAWAVLVDRPPGRWTRRFRKGGRYKIGTSVFLTELAAQRFLAGEADRVVKAGPNSYRAMHCGDLYSRATVLAKPVYTRKGTK
jgi:hypothetical protein